MPERSGGFRCPNCGGAAVVMDVRLKDEGRRVYRRRRCEECDYRFSTDEVVVPDAHHHALDGATSAQVIEAAELLDSALRGVRRN